VSGSSLYQYVRGRQLEGTFPGDKQTGVWPINSYRIGYGWGSPPEESWVQSLPDPAWPPVEPAGMDRLAKAHRFLPYKRVRSIGEGKRLLTAGEPGFCVSLDTSDKWANPPDGRIPVPAPGDLAFSTHFVSVEGYDAVRNEFIFRNSWGNWGRNGYGSIPTDVLAATWWEGWKYVTDFDAETSLEGVFKRPRRDSVIEGTDGSIFYWHEILDDDDNRVAWASALVTEAHLEIEELFVRPEYRRQGHGRSLLNKLRETALGRGLSPKILISFPDAVPHNLEVIEKIVRPIGLSIQASGERFVPWIASPIWQRRQTPLKTFSYPEDPPASPSEIVRIARELLQDPLITLPVSVAGGIVGNFLTDALKSWLKPHNRQKIKAKLGNEDIETSPIEPKDFSALMKELRKVSTEAEIRSRIEETGIKITVINNYNITINSQPAQSLTPQGETQRVRTVKSLKAPRETPEQTVVPRPKKAPVNRKVKRKS
jgi:GNAT superfamily N-acetyltransferase